MKLSELRTNEALRRAEFPVCEKKIFLAHAGVCPLPYRVSQAINNYLGNASRDNQEDVLSGLMTRETRQLAAKLIGANQDEIAFVGSTSMGLGMVAAGLDWSKEDNVVCYQDDYPANVYPWMDLASRGVRTNFLSPKQFGNLTVEDVEKTINERTRLVSLASAHFQSGWRLDVDGIGKMLRSRGILFCLDGIQTFGAIQTSVEHVDFAAADAHKWMLGPVGIGILYVRKELMDRLRPVLVGWNSGACPNFIAEETLHFWPDARRYEPGSLNLLGIVGLHAALSMILEIGIVSIERRVHALVNHVIELAKDKGYTVIGPTSANTDMSGIVSLDSDKIVMSQVHAKLSSDGIVTSLRQIRDGRPVLRIAPHFYNTESELDRYASYL